jgi:hypothetical protein
MLSIGTVYSFQTLAPAILGQKITNVKLTAVVDFNTATRFANIVSQYGNITPHLPAGTPRNMQKYIYYVFETQNGEKKVYADVWIDNATVVVVGGTILKVTVYNADDGAAQAVREFLLSRGNSQISVELE